MKANRLEWTFLLPLLAAIAFELPAQQTEAGRKMFEEARIKAENGDVKSQNLLGDYYYFGDYVAKDYGEAVEWYRKAAERADANAQFSLGLFYYTGDGVFKKGAMYDIPLSPSCCSVGGWPTIPKRRPNFTTCFPMKLLAERTWSGFVGQQVRGVLVAQEPRCGRCRPRSTAALAVVTILP